MYITISLASIATNELVAGWCVIERVKRLADNKIERGIGIPTIESRASNVPIDKGNCIRGLIESSTSWFIRWHHRGACGSQHGYPDPSVGYWPESCLGHVCMTHEPVGSTHLRFDDARVIGKVCTRLLNVVRSPGWDPGRHEEFRNGPEVKIYIWKVVVRVPEKVRLFR